MEEKKYIIYGAGKIGKMMLDYLGRNRIEAFADSFAAGKMIDGLPVIGMKELSLYGNNKTVIVAIGRGADAVRIVGELVQAGIPYIYYTNLLSRFIDEDRMLYESLNRRESFRWNEKYKYEITVDKYASAGSVGSYFWQDIWAARRIVKEQVKNVYDIGSRLDGFIAHLLANEVFVTMVDIRPLPYSIPGLNFIQADATNLDGIADESIDCLSALCSLEHFGLGRYGDPIDPEACFKCFSAIQRKLKGGGKAYISLPK